MTHRGLVLLLLLLPLPLAARPPRLAAEAAPGAGGATLPAAPEGARGFASGLSVDEAVQLAERRYQAKVIKVTVDEAGGRRVYVLRLLSDQGRVWTVRIDAASGAAL